MSDFPVASPSDDLVLEPGQNLVLRDQAGKERVRLSPQTGSLRIRSGAFQAVIRFDGDAGNLLLGGPDHNGELFLFASTADGQDTAGAAIQLNADEGLVHVGTPDRPGQVVVAGDEQGIQLNGQSGSILLSGALELRTASNELRARISPGATMTVGGNGARGRVVLLDGGDTATATVVLNGALGELGLGAAGNAGRLLLKDASGEDSVVVNGATAIGAFGRLDNPGEILVKDGRGEDIIVLRGRTGNVSVGREGNGGDLTLKNDAGEDTIVVRGTTGNVGIGREGLAGNVFVKNDDGHNTIHLNGQSGDIILANADCAEDFDMCDPVPDDAALEAGTVMVIGTDERLRRSDEVYDRRVAGVVSGAGPYRPGIVLDRMAGTGLRRPIALMGKVLCKVDAYQGEISQGDLLTTSSTPGHAMLASDPGRAFGAVLGKALRAHRSGRGLIPVLVALQ